MTINDTDEPCPIALMSAELMCILMRYIVGSELDVYNLELLSMTSSGFYIFARDENLWLAICRSTFRDKYANSVSFDKFVSWRQMYITLPHVYLHGIYIGKISYLRNGEPSFQDKFYKPWHIVVYYRILRFFADGTALMITTADAPSQVVGLLKSKTPSAAGILIGRYWILDQDCIKAEFYRRCEQTVQRKRRTHKSRHQLLPYGVIDQKFDMKLHFGDGKKRQAHCVLHLNEYTCTVTYSNGEKSTNSLDTSDHQTYPPLFFSRVKSYSVPDGWDNILA
ncbi:unnamed protein product [Thelazia callipaeda]|uniref:FBO_C domain-containing protein n=1 Tax=Thelazia callipaeda TaxID=103827 RepID=A0A0N5CKM4_THECL|nr:unnamed protein product [Thelazia callipaeda]